MQSNIDRTYKLVYLLPTWGLSLLRTVLNVQPTDITELELNARSYLDHLQRSKFTLPDGHDGSALSPGLMSCIRRVRYLLPRHIALG